MKVLPIETYPLYGIAHIWTTVTPIDVIPFVFTIIAMVKYSQISRTAVFALQGLLFLLLEITLQLIYLLAA